MTAPANPPPVRNARESLAWQAEHVFGPDGPPLLALAGQMPDALAEELAHFVSAVDDWRASDKLRYEAVIWATITAHLPGLAPVLDVLRAHLQDDQPQCVTGATQTAEGDWLHPCALAREAGYQG